MAILGGSFGGCQCRRTVVKPPYLETVDWEPLERYQSGLGFFWFTWRVEQLPGALAANSKINRWKPAEHEEVTGNSFFGGTRYRDASGLTFRETARLYPDYVVPFLEGNVHLVNVWSGFGYVPVNRPLQTSTLNLELIVKNPSANTPKWTVGISADVDGSRQSVISIPCEQEYRRTVAIIQTAGFQGRTSLGVRLSHPRPQEQLGNAREDLADEGKGTEPVILPPTEITVRGNYRGSF